MSSESTTVSYYSINFYYLWTNSYRQTYIIPQFVHKKFIVIV